MRVYSALPPLPLLPPRHTERGRPAVLKQAKRAQVMTFS